MKGALIEMQYVFLFPAMRRPDLNGCRRDRHKETGTSLCFHEGEKTGRHHQKKRQVQEY